MTLQILFECPQCNQPLPLNLQDYAPNRRQVCTSCHIPAQITKAGLEHFSRDLHQYCQS